MRVAVAGCAVLCCAMAACIPTSDELAEYGLAAFLKPFLYVGLAALPVAFAATVVVLRRRERVPSWAYCVFAATLAAGAAAIIAFVASAVLAIAAVFLYDALA